jgi:hypothetical protein
MYEKMQTSWNSALYTYDSESCIVTWLLPCHTYAKLRLSSYGCHFLSYAFFVLAIRNIWSSWSYIHMNKCPATHTDQCFMVKNHCENHYMHVDGVPAACIYIDDLDVCIYNSVSCIRVHPHLYIFFTCMLSISYVCLWMMNYAGRRVIRETYQLKEDKECIASTILSPCGLSQAYREIV